MKNANTAPTAQEAIDRRLPTLPKDETARLGTEIYQRDIRPLVEADHVGKLVAIDVESGNWAMDTELLDAVDSLRERYPNVVNVWRERIGHRAVGSMGGGSTLIQKASQ